MRYCAINKYSWPPLNYIHLCCLPPWSRNPFSFCTMDNSLHSTDGTDIIGPDPTPRKTLGHRLRRIRHAFMTREGLIGNHDYALLFRPDIPFLTKGRKTPPFFGLNDPMPILLALLLGLQHALAMLGGIVAPPIIMAGAINLSTELTQYMVSTSLIVCGLLSLVQITRFHIYNTPYVLTSCRPLMLNKAVHLLVWATV
jgi:uric acid-xanthine permease